jgi:hypothetical protein
MRVVGNSRIAILLKKLQSKIIQYFDSGFREKIGSDMR